MNQLRQMSVFAHIVETGSITSAAEFLQLSKSVVSQHLKTLEQELGVTLLKRTTRRQTLTSAGKDFYQHCKEINDIANRAWHQAQEVLDVPKGDIRITAPYALMGTLVAPAIGELVQHYPLLTPELISSDNQLDLIAENIDLAIRVGQSKDSAIKQRRIGEFRDVLCASKKVMERGDPDKAAYIANSWQGKHIVHNFTDQSGKSFLYTTTPQCRANSFHACLSLIESGAGIGLIPDFQLRHIDPRLYNVFPQHILPINSVYALYTFNTQVPLSVRVCLTAIEQQLSLFMNA